MSLRVLVIGSGGREHALANAIERSPHVGRLFVAPGNGGTAEHNVALDIDNHVAVARFAQVNNIDLVVIGPEAPLVAGLTDHLQARGVSVFGPTAAAAQLEGSKDFTRAFAERVGIASPRYAAFDNAAEAIAWVHDANFNVVVKADGLAGGKGVTVTETCAEAATAIEECFGGKFGNAGTKVVLEERLEGTEVSLLGFCDGKTVSVMPPAQDHKPAYDGDLGPNTGGMGVFAPTPSVSPEDLTPLAEEFLGQTIAALAADGSPFVGVLYAGLMMTTEGPRLLEYNVRFGDPEAEVLLPLLETDIIEILAACVTGELDQIPVRWSDDACTGVIVASSGYPGEYRVNLPIEGLESVCDEAFVYHAGTRIDGDLTVTAGGRVLCVSAVGPTLEAATERAYASVAQVGFEGSFHRHDIGRLNGVDTTSDDPYAAAGVDIAAGHEAVDLIAAAVAATHDERVLRGIGAFGGALSLVGLPDDPVLVASTDGVGTKSLLGAAHDRWENLGADIVNHGINDVLVQGARPLAFLDTISADKLDPSVVERIVTGMAEACASVSCPLLGGETAEMPGVIAAGAVDITGTMLGVASAERLLPRHVQAGHVLVGLRSSGPHTNGYTLIRQAVAEHDGADIDALLAPHRSYLEALEGALDSDLVEALVHITGGGFAGNIPRALPDGLGAWIDTSSWPTPPVFEWLVDNCSLDLDNAHKVFNMGIGMVAVIAPQNVDSFVAAVDETTYVIGEVTDRPGVALQ